MVTPQGVVLVLIGAAACLMGYSMFRSMLPMWGFMLGGFILMTFAPTFIEIGPSQQLLLTIGSFVVGGVIGALIAKPLYYGVVFFSGAALGALIGIVGGSLVDMGGITSFRDIDTFTSMTLTFPPQVTTMTQLVMIIVIGGIMGALAISFQQFMITASSAFLGSAALVSGLSNVITNSFQTLGGNVLLIAAWILIGLIGLFVQYRIMGDEI